MTILGQRDNHWGSVAIIGAVWESGDSEAIIWTVWLSLGQCDNHWESVTIIGTVWQLFDILTWPAVSVDESKETRRERVEHLVDVLKPIVKLDVSHYNALLKVSLGPMCQGIHRIPVVVLLDILIAGYRNSGVVILYKQCCGSGRLLSGSG